MGPQLVEAPVGAARHRASAMSRDSTARLSSKGFGQWAELGCMTGPLLGKHGEKKEETSRAGGQVLTQG
jgi:hypothetical protein